MKETDSIKVLLLSSYEPKPNGGSDLKRASLMSYPGQLTAALYGYAIREKQDGVWKEIGYLDSKKRRFRNDVIVWNTKVFNW